MTDETDIETTERSLIISRTFDAQRKRVWEAWTDPDEIEQWLCPEVVHRGLRRRRRSTWWSVAVGHSVARR